MVQYGSPRDDGAIQEVAKYMRVKRRSVNMWGVKSRSVMTGDPKEITKYLEVNRWSINYGRLIGIN